MRQLSVLRCILFDFQIDTLQIQVRISQMGMVEVLETGQRHQKAGRYGKILQKIQPQEFVREAARDCSSFIGHPIPVTKAWFDRQVTDRFFHLPDTDDLFRLLGDQEARAT